MTLQSGVVAARSAFSKRAKIVVSSTRSLVTHSMWWNCCDGDGAHPLFFVSFHRTLAFDARPVDCKACPPVPKIARTLCVPFNFSSFVKFPSSFAAVMTGGACTCV